MGFELGAGPLRRAPRGWLPARAFAVEHSVYSHAARNREDSGGPAEIETSVGLTVTWRVEIDGRAPYELHEERSAPMWTLANTTLGSGNRWYKVRVRPQYGLMAKLGIPCLVDPANAAKLWIDWDAAYAEHVPAWEREARVRRELARREGRLEGVLERVTNPFAGTLRPGEEQLVDEAQARREARERELQEQYAERAREQMAQRGILPVTASDAEEQKRRMDELARIQRTGRKAKATLVSREDTDRTLANIPLILLTFEIEGRRVVFEHVYGPRHAKRYKPGKTFDVWIDPADPDGICPGRG
jgi:hypothetical protein